MFLFLSMYVYLATASSSNDHPVKRLRYFVDQVNQYTRQSSVPALQKPDFTEEIVHSLVDDAVRFAMNDARETDVVFHTMGLICQNAVSRSEYDNVMWEAMQNICTSLTSRDSSAGNAPAVVLAMPTTNLAQIDDDGMTLMERRGGEHVYVDTGIQPDVSASNKRKRIRFDSSADSSFTSDELPTSDKSVDNFLPSAKQSEVTPDISPVSSAQILLHLKLQRLFDSVQESPLSTPTDGQRYLSRKHELLALSGSYKRISDNFDLLNYIGAPESIMATVFSAAYLVLTGPTENTIDEAWNAKLESIMKEKSEFVHRPLEYTQLRNNLRKYCKDPRLAGKISPVEPSRKWARISKKLSEKATGNDLMYVRSTVDFLELAGISKILISNVLRETCPVLFPESQDSS